MATVYASFALDLNDLSLYTLIEGGTSVAFLNDNNFLSPIGNTYQDVLKFGFTADSNQYFGHFAGTDFTFNNTFTAVTGGTVNGYFETVNNGSSYVTNWGVEGFSYSAASFYLAATTATSTDDYAVLATILSGADTFNLSAFADRADGYAGNDTMIGGAGNDTLGGGAGNDSLLGGGGIDSLSGGGGNDTLNGGLGADKLGGGIGNDTYQVTAGDVVTESASAGIDSVISSVNWTLAVNIEKLTLGGTGNINGTGNALANTITGNAGNNKLNGFAGVDNLVGNAGNDTLNGGIGKDVLKGGAGADAFLFNSALSDTTNVDKVVDFSSGLDKLQLDDDIFAALDAGVSSSLLATQFYKAAGAVAAQDADDRVVYNTTTGDLYFDADGTGALAAVRFAVLGTATHPDLVASDFLIVA